MINVLVVDDSAFYRVNISQAISKDKEMKVIATVKDGSTALEKIKDAKPDVITIDFQLAGISGDKVIKEISKKYDIPIIIVSSFKGLQDELALTALESGVFDFVEKPDSFDQDALLPLKEELLKKIKLAHKYGQKKIPEPKKKEEIEFSDLAFNYSNEKIIVIASSTGGPQTLERFVPELPDNIPCPVLIVQHMPPIFTKSLAERLDKLCNLRVVEAKDGDELRKGFIYIAPGDYHMEIKLQKKGLLSKKLISLNQEEKEEAVRPCANKLFRSAAPIYKENTIAIVLTGMGSDGTNGAREIKKYNGSVIAQSEKTSIIYGMPKSIVTNNLADEIIDIDKMTVAILQLLEV